MEKAGFNKKRAPFTSKMDLELRKKLVKCYIWATALYGAETWTFRTVDQKHLSSSVCAAGVEVLELPPCAAQYPRTAQTTSCGNIMCQISSKQGKHFIHDI
jgi:hypothetical protein